MAKAQRRAPRRPRPRGTERTETTTTEVKSAGKVIHHETDTDHEPVASIVNPGNVAVAMSATKNLGEFESVKFSLHVSEPFDPDVPGARDAKLAEVKTYVQEVVMGEIAGYDDGEA